MLEIKIDPQLHRTQDPPLTSSGEGGRRGELRLRFQKPTKDLLPGGNWRRRIMHPLQRVDVRINVKNCHALLTRTNSSDN